MKKFTMITMVMVGFLSVPGSAQTTITIQPDALTGNDARVNSLNTYTTGTDIEMPFGEWTFGGTPGIDRGLISFDLSSIPCGAVITSAELYLYGASGLPSGGHSTLSGSNDWMIERITSPWNETTVTWGTQPSVSPVNSVLMPASTSATQDYVADVSVLLQDMIADPSTAYGFRLSLVTEEYYRRMNFCTSEHTNAAKRPKLVITYNEDLTAPVPDVAVLPDLDYSCVATMPAAPLATDICAGTVTGVPDLAFPIDIPGSYVVNWSFDDGNGNVSTQAQNLTVTTTVFDNTVLNDGVTLTAVETGCQYQWVTCPQHEPVPGETGQTFTPGAPGSYAVIFALGGCLDVTECRDFVNITPQARIDLSLYPNPVHELLYIEMTGNGLAELQLFDITGRLVHTLQFTGSYATLDLNGTPAGTYIVQITSGEQIITRKITKN